jgi:hypothetical protein
MAKKSQFKEQPAADSSTSGMGFEASVDLLPGSSTYLIDKEGAPGAKPTVTLQRTQLNQAIVWWGKRNNYPLEVLELAIQSPELLALLDFMTTVIYGDGIGYEVIDPKTGHYVPCYDQEVQDWLNANCVDDWLLENIMDCTWFNHGFAEMILTKNRQYICSIGHQEAAFCRFSKQDKITGYNNSVFINANWPNGSVGDDYTTEVPTINPNDLNKVDTVRNGTSFKYIFSTTYPFPGKLTYQLTSWHALFSSKWFDISKMIPILKYALMKFQMTIKYLIEVPEEFWAIQARDRLDRVWGEMKPLERNNLKKLVKKEMDDFLTGPENSGKAFMTTFGWDKVNKMKIPGVSITVLDDKLKDGSYNMDTKEASGQFARAVGLPLALMGPLSSGDMGAGSGSDARIHWNILNNRLKTRKLKAVKPLNFVADFNGWTKRLPGFRFYLKNSVMDTLDVNHSTSNPAPGQAAPKTPTDGNTD